MRGGAGPCLRSRPWPSTDCASPRRGQTEPAACLVEQAMVATTEENEVREPGFAAGGPVFHVVAAAVLRSAAEKAARDDAGLAADGENLTIAMCRAYPSGVAGDSSGCFRGRGCESRPARQRVGTLLWPSLLRKRIPSTLPRKREECESSLRRLPQALQAGFPRRRGAPCSRHL